MTTQTKRHIAQAALAWGLLIAYMCLFRPQHLPAVLLIVPFILLFIALVTLWTLLAPIGMWLLGKQPRYGAHRLKFTICGSAVLCLVMQSLGQLTVRDLATILAIVAIGYAYVGRSRSTTKQS